MKNKKYAWSINYKNLTNNLTGEKKENFYYKKYKIYR